jgi:hypothetical protein
MEDLVGKIKGFSGGKAEDFTKMFTDAKGKFDGFMKGLNELKGLVGMK